MIPTPSSKPQAGLQLVEKHAREAWKLAGRTGPMPGTFVLAVRAYRRDTMGKPGVNDLNMYDDAVFIVTPTHFSAWNANVDPTRYGWNPNADKYMARLKTGVWWFKHLKHKVNSPNGYMAFGQGSQHVRVERIRQDGSIATTEQGQFGINLHRGGENSTSSEGCNTIPPRDWPEFYKTLSGLTGNLLFPYILIDGPIV